MGELAERLLVRLGRRAPWRISPGWWRWVVRPALMALPAPKLRRTLRTGLVYRPYLSLRVQFDTSDADACLLPHGVRCPRVLDYIDTIVDAAIATDFGRRVAAT
jgi:hypothetical protein